MELMEQHQFIHTKRSSDGGAVHKTNCALLCRAAAGGGKTSKSIEGTHLLSTFAEIRHDHMLVAKDKSQFLRTLMG